MLNQIVFSNMSQVSNFFISMWNLMWVPEWKRKKTSSSVSNVDSFKFQTIKTENPSNNNDRDQVLWACETEPPTKPLFSLKPLDATAWLGSLLTKVLRQDKDDLSYDVRTVNKGQKVLEIKVRFILYGDQQ